MGTVKTECWAGFGAGRARTQPQRVFGCESGGEERQLSVCCLLCCGRNGSDVGPVGAEPCRELSEPETACSECAEEEQARFTSVRACVARKALAKEGEEERELSVLVPSLWENELEACSVGAGLCRW